MNIYDRTEIEHFLIENYSETSSQYLNRKKDINELYKKFNNNIKWIYYTEYYYKFLLKKIYVSNYGDLIIKKCKIPFYNFFQPLSKHHYNISFLECYLPFDKNKYKIYERRNEIEGIELKEEDKNICRYISNLSNKKIKDKIDERLLEKYENLTMKLNDKLIFLNKD